MSRIDIQRPIGILAILGTALAEATPSSDSLNGQPKFQDSYWLSNLRSPAALEVDPSFYYSASNNTDAVFEFEGLTLYARGVVVDTVDGLACSRNFEMVQTSEWSSMQSSSCSGSTCSIMDILISVRRSLVWDRKDRYLRHAMPTRLSSRLYFLTCPDCNKVELLLSQGIAGTVSMDHVPSHSQP